MLVGISGVCRDMLFNKKGVVFDDSVPSRLMRVHPTGCIPLSASTVTILPAITMLLPVKLISHAFFVLSVACLAANYH